MGRLKKVPREFLIPVADRVVALLKDHTSRIQVCGSLRRGDKLCGDIDIVTASPLNANIPYLISKEFGGVYIDSDGSKGPRRCYIIEYLGKEVSIDVWVIPPDSFGAAVMYCTGPGMFNTIMRRAARAQGLNLSLLGVSNERIVLARETEEDCFKAIGWKYLEPHERSDWKAAVDPYLEKINEKCPTLF